MPPGAMRLAERFWPGPLTLVLDLRPGAVLPSALTGGTRRLGVRLPDHPVPRSIARILGPIAVTSANRSGEPEALDAETLRDQLGGSIALIVDGGPVPARGRHRRSCRSTPTAACRSFGPARSRPNASSRSRTGLPHDRSASVALRSFGGPAGRRGYTGIRAPAAVGAEMTVTVDRREAQDAQASDRLASVDPELWDGDARRARPPALEDRADRQRELRLRGGAGGPGLVADQQVRRGPARASATTAAASSSTSSRRSPRSARWRCSRAPSTSTSSLTRAPRPTWPRTSRCSSRVTASWA